MTGSAVVGMSGSSEEEVMSSRDRLWFIAAVVTSDSLVVGFVRLVWRPEVLLTLVLVSV